MVENLFYLPKNEAEPLPVGEWFYALIVCPSQCYYRMQHKGMDYMLYLRWRHEDPWQAYVIKNAASLVAMNKDGAIWSEDVFELQHVQYSDEEIELAKEKIVRLFYEFNGEFPQRSSPKQKA